MDSPLAQPDPDIINMYLHCANSYTTILMSLIKKKNSTISAMISAHAVLLKNSKTRVKTATQKDQKLVFMTNYTLMKVKSIAECSKGSILQYFRPSSSFFALSIFEWLFYTGFTVHFREQMYPKIF